jgi:hypothetical protein
VAQQRPAYSDRAAAAAMMQCALDLRSTSDKAGESVWLRVFDVILELERSILARWNGL